MPRVLVALALTGKGVGEEIGAVGTALGTGVAVGKAVAVALGAAVGLAVAAAVGRAVGVGVAVGTGLEGVLLAGQALRLRAELARRAKSASLGKKGEENGCNSFNIVRLIPSHRKLFGHG